MTAIEQEGLRERLRRSIAVSEHSGCWEWRYHRNPQGYGTAHALGKTWQAHRLAWTVYRGDIGAGLCVLHHCDNEGCINPAHLFLGSQQDNADDYKTKFGKQKRTGPHCSAEAMATLRQIGIDKQAVKMAVKWPQELLDKVIALRAEGKTVAETTAATGVPGWMVTKAMRQYGLTSTRRWSEERIREAIRLLESGLKFREVAAALMCPLGSVQIMTGWRKYGPHRGWAAKYLSQEVATTDLTAPLPAPALPCTLTQNQPIRESPPEPALPWEVDAEPEGVNTPRELTYDVDPDAFAEAHYSQESGRRGRKK